MENNQNRNRVNQQTFEPIQRSQRPQNQSQRPVQGANRPVQRSSQSSQGAHQLTHASYTRVNPQQRSGRPINRSQSSTERIEQIRRNKQNSKPPKKPSKAIITLTSILLAGLITLTIAVTALQPKPEKPTPGTTEVTTTINIGDDTTSITRPNSGSPVVQPETPETNEERIYELDEINPTYEFITWKGKKQLTIDDDSMKQIVQLALRDAVDFYYDLDAPNCSFVLKDGKVTNTTGKENFLEKQMNWQYYMGRIYQEASGHIMVDFVNDIGEGENNPNGIFGSMPLSTNKTLNEYFRDIFHVTVDFAKKDSVITKEEVSKVLSSKETAKAVTEKIYNATLKVIIDDIHKLKSMTKGHEDCYLPYANMTPDEIMSKYSIDESLRDEVIDICNELKAYDGKYSPTLALAGLQATHLYGFSDVRSSMKNGSFFANYFNKEYIFKTFGNTDKIEESGLFYQ